MRPSRLLLSPTIWFIVPALMMMMMMMSVEQSRKETELLGERLTIFHFAHHKSQLT
jgi:hypothetical protein